MAINGTNWAIHNTNCTAVRLEIKQKKKEKKRMKIKKKKKKRKEKKSRCIGMLTCIFRKPVVYVHLC